MISRYSCSFRERSILQGNIVKSFFSRVRFALWCFLKQAQPTCSVLERIKIRIRITYIASSLLRFYYTLWFLFTYAPSSRSQYWIENMKFLITCLCVLKLFDQDIVSVYIITLISNVITGRAAVKIIRISGSNYLVASTSCRAKYSRREIPRSVSNSV